MLLGQDKYPFAIIDSILKDKITISQTISHLYYTINEKGLAHEMPILFH